MLSHHSILVPIGYDSKRFLNRHRIKKLIHSVSDKILRSFVVYDIDSPAVEVWLLNFYFEL